MGITPKTQKPSKSPCAQLRLAYDNCFNKWYTEKFVKGNCNIEDCASEWQKYRACLSEHLDDKHFRRFLEAEISPPVPQSPSVDDGAAAADTGIWQQRNRTIPVF